MVERTCDYQPRVEKFKALGKIPYCSGFLYDRFRRKGEELCPKCPHVNGFNHPLIPNQNNPIAHFWIERAKELERAGRNSRRTPGKDPSKFE